MRNHSNPVLVLGFISLSTLVTLGCAQKPMEQSQQRTVHKIPSEPPQTPAGNPETPPPSPSEDVVAAGLKAKEEFQKALTEDLSRLDEQMRELQLKVATLTEEAKAGWAGKLDELEAKRKAAGATLSDIRSASGEAWEHLRDGSQAAWQELETAIKKAAEEF